jgi:hypothetical protein
LTNSGTLDHDNQHHDRVWFLPGGESAGDAAVMTAHGPFLGTSSACAYATSLIASSILCHGTELTYAQLARADGAGMDGYDADVHGHGRMTCGALEDIDV